MITRYRWQVFCDNALSRNVSGGRLLTLATKWATFPIIEDVRPGGIRWALFFVGGRMTTICIRDGVIACDSSVNDHGVVVGSVCKIRPVPDTFGGGYISWAGNFGEAEDAIASFTKCGGLPKVDGSSFMHLRADGTAAHSDNGGSWFEFEAPFYAIGSGFRVAIGAMAAGATAVEAVKIACQYDADTDGRVYANSLEP